MSTKKQMEMQAQQILLKRQGKGEQAHSLGNRIANEHKPATQHAAAVKRLLARRGIEVTAPEVTAPVMEIDPVLHDYTDPKWEKKHLKAECDRLNIQYAKKVTRVQLIELLLGV